MSVGAAYYPVDPLTSPGKWCESGARKTLLHAMTNTDVRIARAGSTSLRLGKMEIDFIGTREEDFMDSPNSTSIINLVRYGDNSFLFTGDQAAVGEPVHLAHMLEDAKAFGFSSLKVDMVKRPHHGNCNPGEDFWKATDPGLIVVPNNGKSGAVDSASKRNVRQNAPNAQLLKLSSHDSITLVSDGSRIEVFYDVEPSRWKRN